MVLRAGGLLGAGGGQGGLGLLPAGGRPRQLPGAVPGGLPEFGAEPVALGTQLRGRELEQVGGARRVDRQRLPAGPAQRAGELLAAVARVGVGQVQLGRLHQPRVMGLKDRPADPAVAEAVEERHALGRA
ncbi:MAG TPA: hypothetical protein VG276_30675 [Actinomycetes bacterium]|nr:hypothetical protein [Actinomycetes bacterium]